MGIETSTQLQKYLDKKGLKYSVEVNGFVDIIRVQFDKPINAHNFAKVVRKVLSAKKFKVRRWKNKVIIKHNLLGW